MDLNSLGTKSIDKLKCTACRHYLSHFPIRVGPNLQIVCGRCPDPASPSFHNHAFETISQFFAFPCLYKPQGCDEELQPKEVPQHEKDCKFRLVSCPVIKWIACEWQGTRHEKLNHCENKHRDMFSNEFIINLSQCDEGFKLVNHENFLMVFVWKFEKNTKMLKFEMYSTEFELEIWKYSCQLGIKCGNKNLSLDFVTTDFENVKVNEMSLESIVNQSVHNATIKISIGDELNKSSRDVNLELLSVLKCFACLHFAIPPIYHCVQNSETLCGDCKPIHQPSCAPCSQTANTRNINLDKMAFHLNYPCKFQKNGCSHISKPEQIVKHQSVCDLSDFNCPLSDFESCQWKGLLKDMEEHIQNEHQELVTNSSQLSKQLIPERMKCDILKFSNQLFRLVCLKTPQESYLWTVQVIGQPKRDFLYEIEIVDSRNKSLRLVVRQPCGLLTKKDDVFKKGDYCYFLKDQICDFVVDQVITFKIRIFI